MISVFKGIAWFIRLEWRRYLAAFCMLACISGCNMMIPLLTGRIIDAIDQKNLTRELLLKTCLCLAGLAMLIYVMRILWRVFLFGASYQLSVQLRRQIFKKFSLLSQPFFDRTRTGDLMTRATHDIEAVEMTAGEGILALVDGTMSGLVVVSIMILQIDWRLTVVSLLPWPLAAHLMFKLGKDLHLTSRRAQDSFADLNNHTQECISGIRLIRCLGRETYDKQHFEKLAERSSTDNLAVARLEARYNPVITLSIATSFLLCIMGGTWLIARGELTIGKLTSFMMYLGYMVWPMFAIGWLFNIVERGKASLDRLQEIFQLQPDIKDDGSLHAMGRGLLTVHVESFRYPSQERTVLHHVKFALQPGDILGIAGPVGSGKSSILKLIMRMYEDAGVHIEMDGQALGHYSLKCLREATAHVSQEPFIFTATLAENIALGRPEATHAEIEQAAIQAALYEDVQSFPKRFETLVGERGVTLSGGQKQRLALARALLLKSRFLLLDDALSAVDVHTERKIIQHLKSGPKKQNTSTIMVSHRLSALEHADHILVIHEGRILEQGHHQQLLRLNGWYARMVELQNLERIVQGVSS